MKLFKDADILKAQTVLVKDLKASQPTISLKGVEGYINQQPKNSKLPEVLKLKGGGYLILDGHHRAVAQVMKGYSGLRVNIVGEA